MTPGPEDQGGDKESDEDGRDELGRIEIDGGGHVYLVAGGEGKEGRPREAGEAGDNKDHQQQERKREAIRRLLGPVLIGGRRYHCLQAVAEMRWTVIG